MNSKSMLGILVALPIALVSCSKQDETITTTATGDYPLTTCVVSGEPLGSMGEPVVHEHNGVTVKFCCDSCLPKFNKDPDAYLAKVTGS